MSARDYLPWMSASEHSPAERASEEQAPAMDASRDSAASVASGDASPVDTGRRDLVKLLGGGGLLFAAGPFGIRRLEAAERVAGRHDRRRAVGAHASIRLAEDGIITIVCHRSEMGQDSHHDADDHRRRDRGRLGKMPSGAGVRR
ncbi:MAG: hypothetical protein IPK33_25745 [Gemmatimonadetes bacterium]|nr:hypothetical protein [Gemmatimonadota bacterium]